MNVWHGTPRVFALSSISVASRLEEVHDFIKLGFQTVMLGEFE